MKLLTPSDWGSSSWVEDRFLRFLAAASAELEYLVLSIWCCWEAAAAAAADDAPPAAALPATPAVAVEETTWEDPPPARAALEGLPSLVVPAAGEMEL